MNYFPLTTIIYMKQQFEKMYKIENRIIKMIIKWKILQSIVFFVYW